MAQIETFPGNECFMCVIREPAKHDQDWLNRTFHLIRSRYYAVNHEFGGVIDKNNFKRARKGTTAIAFNRDTFININDNIGTRRVSDDTLLLYHLVYELNGKLHVSGKALGTYIPRKDSTRILPWLFNRGSLFADFYLIKGGYYYRAFMAFLLFVCAGIIFRSFRICVYCFVYITLHIPGHLCFFQPGTR